MSQKVLNKRSSVVIEGAPKLPSPQQLEYGEIAVNFASGYETLSILNNSGTIKTFSSDDIIDKRLNDFSASVITELSGKQDTIADLDEIRNNSISGASAYTEIIAHENAQQTHLPAVTSSDNNKVLSVVDGLWDKTKITTVYYGTIPPSSNIGNNGDIYAQLGSDGEVVYYNSGTGVLASSSFNVTFSKELSDFDYVLCYFRASKNNIGDTMAIPAMVARINLDLNSALPSGEFCGGVQTPYINDKNRYAAYSCVINSQKTQFRIAYQQSLYGTGTTSVSDDSHGVYCYKIVAFRENVINTLL